MNVTLSLELEKLIEEKVARGQYASRDAVVLHAKGCERCMGTGYLGRTAIYELMLLDDRIRSLILKNTDSGTIKRAALENGMRTLRMDGARRVLAGATTIEELLRVTEEDTINL